MENIIEKKPLYKQKKVMIPAVLGLMLVSVFAVAGVLFASVSVDVGNNEPLSTPDSVFSLSMMAGEVQQINHTIVNDGQGTVSSEIAWNEINNTGVEYTLSRGGVQDIFIVSVPPGTNVYQVNISTSTNSSVGSFAGNFTDTRF